jgi:hypothetical protein
MKLPPANRGYVAPEVAWPTTESSNRSKGALTDFLGTPLRVERHLTADSHDR